MPLDLASTQALLLDFITGRPDGGAAAALVIGDERAPAEERLHVYAHMYRARLIEALQAVYPRHGRHLGPDELEAIASAYIDAHPSRNPSLRFFGAELPGWLARHRAEAPLLAALARLEWSRYDVFDAADETALELDALRALPPEAFATLPLAAIGAHRLITVESGTAALWDAAGVGDLPEDETAAEQALEVADDDNDGEADGLVATAEAPASEVQAPSREIVLVWRQGTVVYHRVVEADEAAAFASVAAGTTFGAVCETLASALPPGTAAARAFAWLSIWATDGLLLA